MVWFQDDFEKLKSKFKVTDIHKHLSYFSSEQCGKVLKNKNFKSQDQSNFDHLSVKLFSNPRLIIHSLDYTNGGYVTNPLCV